MVRIKAQTMAVSSFGPQNGPCPPLGGSGGGVGGGDAYGSYLPGASYQQPSASHLSPRQLCDFPPAEVWASGYPECSEVRDLQAAWR